jgi:glutamate--cysteine ligase
MSLIFDTLKHLSATRGDEIEQWFSQQRRVAPPFITSSVDLRHSGLRLAPVDTNLYPAGFNNLSPAALARSARFIRHLAVERFPQARRVLIIPENHTRNMGYLENLSAMLDIFAAAGLETQLGSLAALPGEPIALETPSGIHLTEHPLTREGGTLRLENGFTPDVIVMNNDMTSGEPDILHNITQPVLPPTSLGWWQRRKSIHFAAYRELIADFGATFAIDPWLLSADFTRCGIVDFKERTGLDYIAREIETMLARAREKHRQYGINEAPYAYIKADSGTYGMGIMTVHAPEDVLELNKKERNKMQIIKEGARNAEVIIQEGIPTIDRVDGKPAEPMVYMIDGIPVGGMYRVNGNRDALGNLNASGMEFTGMCDESEDECGRWRSVRDCHFRSFGIVAAIAALAAGREDYSTGKDGEGI